MTEQPLTPEYDPELEWPCATAEEFLERLQPNNPIWGLPRGRDPREWIFRGHADARWSLTPSVLRPGAVAVEPNCSEAIARRKLEQVSLKQFLRMVDEQGLPLPEDNQQVRDAEAALPMDGYEEICTHGWQFDELWPPIHLLSHFALAQHYGLNTQLLDWSRRPLVAAYFAASDAINRKQTEGEMAVWGLAEPAVVQFCARHREGQPQALVVSAPYATNPNLRAQHGVFTVVRTRGEDTPPTIDTVLSDGFAYANQPEGVVASLFYYPFLRKVTVPVAEAPKLLRLLAYHRVHAGTVYPGYAGVVMAMKERDLWDKPPGDFPFVLS